MSRETKLKTIRQVIEIVEYKLKNKEIALEQAYIIMKNVNDMLKNSEK